MAGDEPTHDELMKLHTHGVTPLYTHGVYRKDTMHHTGNGRPCRVCMELLLGISPTRQVPQHPMMGPIYMMAIPCTRWQETAPMESYIFDRDYMEMPTRIMPADVPPPPELGRFGGEPENGNCYTDATNSSFTEAATAHLRTTIPFAESIAPTHRPTGCGPPGQMHEDDGATPACTPGCATRCHASAFCSLAAGHTGHCDCRARSGH